MSSNNKTCSNMEGAVKGLFNFETDEEKLEFDAEQLHLSIMFKVKKLMDEKGWNKSDLATALNVKKPHVTKLFSAEKLINIKMMAKIETVFGINFNVGIFKKVDLNSYEDNLIDFYDYNKLPKYSKKEIVDADKYLPVEINSKVKKVGGQHEKEFTF